MIIDIPEWKFESFKKKIDKLNRTFQSGNKATYTVLKTYTKNVQFGSDYQINSGYHWNTIPAVIYQVDLNFDIQNRDWKIVAILSRQLNNDVTVETISDVSIPKDMYDLKGIRCDHCNTNRKRNQGAIVYSSTLKTYKVLGSACINDYTAISISDIKQMFDLINNLTDDSFTTGMTRLPIDHWTFNVEEGMCAMLAIYYSKELGSIHHYQFYGLHTLAYSALAALHYNATQKDIKGFNLKAVDYILKHDISEFIPYAHKIMDYVRNNPIGYGEIDHEKVSNTIKIINNDYIREEDFKYILYAIKMYENSKEFSFRRALAYSYEVARGDYGYSYLSSKEKSDKKDIVLYALNLIDYPDDAEYIKYDGLNVDSFDNIYKNNLDIVDSIEEYIKNNKQDFLQKIQNNKIKSTDILDLIEIVINYNKVQREQREREEHEQYERRERAKKYNGDVGQQIEVEIIHISSCKELKSKDGNSSYYLIKGYDKDHRLYVWFSKKPVERSNFTIKGTVKYQGINFYTNDSENELSNVTIINDTSSNNTNNLSVGSIVKFTVKNIYSKAMQSKYNSNDHYFVITIYATDGNKYSWFSKEDISRNIKRVRGTIKNINNYNNSITYNIEKVNTSEDIDAFNESLINDNIVSRFFEEVII